MPPNKYLISDHRGIYVDMTNSLAFGGLNYDLRQKRKRKLTTKSTKATLLYKKDLSRALKDPYFQTMLDNIEDANDQDRIIQNLEAVDTHIDQCITRSYGKIKFTPLQWWTEDIHHADLL
eukprot:7924560-Ditylum_brightwellii.AAC.1